MKRILQIAGITFYASIGKVVAKEYMQNFGVTFNTGDLRGCDQIRWNITKADDTSGAAFDEVNLTEAYVDYTINMVDYFNARFSETGSYILYIQLCKGSTFVAGGNLQFYFCKYAYYQMGITVPNQVRSIFRPAVFSYSQAGLHVDTETAYNVCFLWGLDQIEGLKDAGNIEDMDLGAFTMAGQPDASGFLPVKYSAYDSAMVSDAPFFALTEGGQGVANEDGSFPVECVPAPFIRALWLFDLIMQGNGVAYKMDASALYDLRHLVIPICGREVAEDDFSLSSSGVGTFNNPSNRATFTSSKGVEFLASDAAKQIAVLSGAVPVGSAMSKPNEYEIGFSGSGSADVKVSGKATIPAHKLQFTLRVCVDAYVYDEAKGWGDKVTFSEHAKDRIIQSNESGAMVIDWSVTVPLEFEYANNYVLFRVYAKSVDGSFPGATLSAMSFAFTGVSVENAGYKSTIQIAKNIPNMKQIDFIKTVCNVLGVFAMPPANGSDVIRFVMADVFRADEAQDWSGYLVEGGDSMQFTFGDLAQKNIITFKERSDDGEPTTAYFEVSNENIEKESTYLELPLTELAGGRFKLFTKEVKEDGTIEYNRENLDDVFMFLADQGGTAFATWQGMTPKYVLGRFSDFADMVKAPVVVKRRFRLSPVVLKNVDFCKPVYIRQTGRFYGIISISAGGELATVELLQMDL